MAYNITEEKLLEEIIRNPDWALFYQRARVKELLPAMAEAYILVDRLKKQVENLSNEIKEQTFICPGCKRGPEQHICHQYSHRNPLHNKPCICDTCEGRPCQCVECKMNVRRM